MRTSSGTLENALERGGWDEDTRRETNAIGAEMREDESPQRLGLLEAERRAEHLRSALLERS